jgi:hypothetical protein
MDLENEGVRMSEEKLSLLDQFRINRAPGYQANAEKIEKVSNLNSYKRVVRALREKEQG